MKKLQKFLSILMSLSVLSFFSACNLIPTTSVQKDTETIYIGGIDPTKNIEVTENNQHFDFEICKQYTVYFQVKDEDYKEDLYKVITERYNVSTTKVCYSYASNYSNIIAYNLYPLSKSENNQMTFTYQDVEYTFTYDIVDYDFEKYAYRTPLSLDDLSAYPEFTEAVQSLAYHEFQGPYIGLNSYSGSDYWEEYQWTYDFYDEETRAYLYDTEYLQYLTDSVYYPTVLDMVEENSIASRDVCMVFNDTDSVKEGADRTIMERFSIFFAVIDPDCTNPTYPLRFYSYTAIPKESNTTSEKTKKAYEQTYYTTYYQLSKLYPDKYFHLTVGALDISVLEMVYGNVCAFFEDENYIYQIYFSYEF